MAWQRVPDAANPFARGAGIAGALDHEIEIDEQASAYLASIMKNRARPDLVIMGPGMGRREQQEMQEDWMSELGGKLRQGVVHFLGVPPSVKASEVIIKDLNKTAADMEMSLMRQHERDIILQVWRVPPDVIGASQHSNRATAFQADVNLRQNAILPSLESRRRFLQTRFFDQRGDREPEYREDRLTLMYDLPMLVDADQRIEMAKAVPYTVYENELRKWMSLPPTDGGDEVRWIPRGIQRAKPGEEQFDKPEEGRRNP